MDHLSFISLLLTGLIALPLAIVAFILSFKLKRGWKAFFIFASSLIFVLVAIVIPNASIGLCTSRLVWYSDTYDSFYIWYRSDYTIVAFVFAINAVVLSLIALFGTLILLRLEPRDSSKLVVKPTTVTKQINSNYIEELKQLKELLECGALTQEEFDSKKKEVLQGR